MALLSLVVLTRYVIDHLTLGLVAAGPPQLGDDFINYWLGARFAALGQATAAYDRALFYANQQSVIGLGANYKIYVYPPVAMLLSLPLAGFSFLAALAIWSVAGASLCAAVLSRLVGWRIAAPAAIGAPAAFLNLLSGQNGFFTAAILAGGLMLLERRPLGAGLVLGLLAYKPQIGLLLPLALLAGGHWRAMLGTAASAGLLVAASAAFCGIDAWIAFLDQMKYQQQLMQLPHDDWFRRMPTVFSALRLDGAPVAAAFAAQAISAGAAALALVVAWRGRSSLEVKAAVLVIATFLASPYAWDYDMVALLFVAAWLAGDGARTGLLPWEPPLTLALAVLPAVMIAGSLAVSVQIGPVVLWLALAALLWRCFAHRPSPPLFSAIAPPVQPASAASPAARDRGA